MSERLEAIKLAKRVLADGRANPTFEPNITILLARELLDAQGAIDKLVESLKREYDPMQDLIQANRDEILIKHEEAIRRIREAAKKGNLVLVLRILDRLNLFHPMHGESWPGWPEDS